MAANLSIARQIACPVVLISSNLKNEQGHKLEPELELYRDLYMLSSISYVNLEPLILSTAFLKTSKTGAAALKNGVMAVSVLGLRHLESVKKLESQAAEKDLFRAAENLSQCGFTTNRLESGLLYVRDSLAALGLRIFAQTELEQYIVVLAKIEETASTEIRSASETASLEPLIRYNRLYATIDQERLSQGNDRYPV